MGLDVGPIDFRNSAVVSHDNPSEKFVSLLWWYGLGLGSHGGMGGVGGSRVFKMTCECGANRS